MHGGNPSGSGTAHSIHSRHMHAYRPLFEGFFQRAVHPLGKQMKTTAVTSAGFTLVTCLVSESDQYNGYYNKDMRVKINNCRVLRPSVIIKKTSNASVE